MTHDSLTRREFVTRSVGLLAVPVMAGAAASDKAPAGGTEDQSIPKMDLHVHLDKSTIDQVAALSKERGVQFGIVEHAGTKENKYPVVLSNDAELEGYLSMLDGKGVYKGLQAEWTDWASCFSKPVLKRLDYVLTDAMTMPGPDGKRMKLWEPTAVIGAAEEFMDRHVDWYAHRMSTEPIDIFANVTWLPESLAANYDALWTEARLRKVIDAAVKNNVALEISGSLKRPKVPFLSMAKAARVARGEYGDPLPVKSGDEIGQLTLSFNQMMAGLKERDFIRNTFGRYMDEGVARDLLRRPEAARLGGEKRQVVILFSDIRGFTPLAESLSPEATIHLINRHFSRMVEIIRRHRGIIVDFLGDAVLAFFDPLDGPLTPTVRQAVRCALEMQAAQEEANRSEPQYPALPMGIGLHAG